MGIISISKIKKIWFRDKQFLFLLSAKKEKSFKCPICGILADGEKSLDEHKSLHDGKPALQCITCDQIFNSKGSLVRHIRIHVSHCEGE